MNWKLIVPISLVSGLSLGMLANHLNASEGVHYIATLNGDVRLRRGWWPIYHAAKVGDVLGLNDWLRLEDPRSSATVLCHNINPWEVPIGNYPVSKGCPTGPTVAVRAGNRLPTRGELRGYENEALPYLISPRNTAILPGDSLALRWNPAPGADTYEVKIQSLNQRTIWSTQSSETGVTYPNLATLSSGRRYPVTVSTNTGVTSPELNANEFLFWVLDAETVQALEADQGKLAALPLEGDSQTLALAHLYSSYELYQQGIDTLETAIQANSQTAAIYQLQAELYLQIGLTRPAQSRYLDALRLANDHAHLDRQADIQEQLGRIARSVENFEQAIAWLSAAAANYRALLDTDNPAAQEKLTEVQEMIRDAQSRLPGV